jgi:hypothetical protein
LTSTPCNHRLSIPWPAAIHCSLCSIFRSESAPKIHVEINEYRPVVGLSTETVGETSKAGLYKLYHCNRLADCRYDDQRDSKMPNPIMVQEILYPRPSITFLDPTDSAQIQFDSTASKDIIIAIECLYHNTREDNMPSPSRCSILCILGAR